MSDQNFSFAKMISDRMNALKTNAFAVEQAAGLPPDAIRNIIRSTKQDGPTVARAQAICNALGLDFYMGPPRDTGPVTQITLSPDGYALIPLHEAELSAGSGMQNHNSEVIDHLAFRRGWLRRLGVSASTACLAHVTGESMLPTLRPGDIVLIDRSRTEPAIRKFRQRDTRRSTIYALVEDGEARVKRIERPASDTMILLSDNPEFPPELRTGHQAEQLQLSIIGKVVWWGHTVED